MSEDEGRRYEGQAEVKMVLDEVHRPDRGNEGGEKQEPAKKDWERIHSGRMVWFNGLIVLVTAIGATISYFQWDATNESALAAKQSADAAATQVAVMREQMVAQQLPHVDVVEVAWMDPLPPEERQRPQVWLQVANTGVGAAYNTMASAWCHTVIFGEPVRPCEVCDHPVQIRIPKPTLRSNDTQDLVLHPQQEGAWRVLSQPKSSWISVVGWLQFCDSLGNPHANPFCWRFGKLGRYRGPGFRCDDSPEPEPTPINCYRRPRHAHPRTHDHEQDRR